MTNKVFKKLKNAENVMTSTRSKKIGVAATVTATFAISLTVTFTALAAPEYKVEVAGETQVAEVKTFASDPNKIVNDVGLVVDSDDILGVKDPSDGEKSVITVYKQGIAELTVDGQKSRVFTAGTVGELLIRNGVEIGEGDYVSSPIDRITFDGMEIEVIHAFEVTVTADGETEVYATTGGKVGEALTATGVVLYEEDALDGCELSDTLYDGMEITVLRCRYEERTVTEDIEYSTIEQEDSCLYVGQSKIIKKGQNGEAERTYRDKYLGDRLVQSDCISVTTLSEPVNAVKAVGTKPLKVGKNCAISGLTPDETIELDENGLPVDYTTYIDGVATAYSGGGITATGIPAAEGYVAVDPKVIPYGSRLYIVSLDGKYVYGYCIAADTGGFVEGGWADVDLYMDYESECVNFGIRGVRIYIL